ncbi:FtsX-like permease family protein [Clostridium sp. UBA1056]|uniref:FtsX-like permease family protein n=1 Tax=unclassified Clostridium TaxID=2614128 RepID=UPI0032174FAC
MITSIRGCANKLIKSNKFIMISSIFSVIISVILIVGMFMYISSAEKSMINNTKELYGDMDLSVGSSSMYDKKLDKSLVDKISSISGIKELSPVILAELQIEDKTNFNVYSVGTDNSELSKSKYKYTRNISTGEVVINDVLKESLGKDEGDSIVIDGRSFKIIEVINTPKQSNNIPNILFININTLKDMLKDNGEATYLLIKLIDGNKSFEVSENIRSINKNLRIDIAEQDEGIVRNLQSLKVFTFVLSALIIIMCSLLIISNFQIFLYNYRKQFSTIRAIGGSSKQAFSIVFVQATFINIIGVVVGLLASYLSNDLIVKILNNKFSFKVSDINYSLSMAALISIVIFVILEVFMLIPAIRSSKILPLKISEENEETQNQGELGKLIGMAGVIISLILFISEIIAFVFNKGNIFLGVFSAISLVIGVYLLFPYHIEKLLESIMPFFTLVGGKGAFVAIQNLISQVKRSSVIIISLSTVIVIAIFGESFLGVISRNNEEFLKCQFPLEISITDRNKLNSNLGDEFKDDLKRIKDVKSVITLSNISSVYFKGENDVDYADFSLVDYDGLQNEGLIPKENWDLKSSVIISKQFATDQKLKIGDKIEISKARNDGKSLKEVKNTLNFDTFTIKHIINDDNLLANRMILIDYSNDKYVDELVNFDVALVSSFNKENTLRGLDELKKEYPQIKYTTLKEALDESNQILIERWSLFIIVLGAILISLALGIINMLINNVLSKRKEYAILRTLKLEKKDLVKLILTQIVTYVLIGSLLGCVLGFIVSNIVTDSFKGIYIGYKVMLIIVSLLLGISLAIAIPFGISLANKKIADELRVDDK